MTLNVNIDVLWIVCQFLPETQFESELRQNHWRQTGTVCLWYF